MHPDADVDMALVFLAEPALTSPLPPFAEQLAVDGPEELAKLVGYGRTSTPNKDSGVKRSVDVLVGQVDEQVIFLLDRDELLGACSGDSGGPVLLERDGQWTPVAVMTTIFDWDGDEEACGDATLGLLIYPHLAWIQEEVAAVQPEPEPEGEEPQGDPPEEEGGRFGCSSVGGGSSWPLSFGVLALLFVRRRS
jgi:MYXO-CTERM domain-containing protein